MQCRVGDPAWRPSDFAVAPLEGRTAFPEVRHDEGNRDRGPCCAGARDHSAGEWTPPGEHEPNAERGDDEADLLLRERGDHRADRKRLESSLVEKPNSEEQCRCGERDGMELVHCEPRGCRIQEVGERERNACSLRREVLARQPEDR